MMCGETCGAVTAGLMILGLLHGHTEPNDIRQKEEMTSVAMKFRERMLGEFGSTMCEELLGHPIPSEMDKVLEEGTMFTLCPRIVKAAIEAVSELV